MTFLQDKILGEAKGVEDSYAYMFGSVGFISFNSKTEMTDFLKTMNAKKRPEENGTQVWVSASKSPDRQKKGRKASISTSSKSSSST